MRRARRASIHVLLGNLASRARARGRPHSRRCRPDLRGQPPEIRRAQDKARAGEGGHRGLQAPDKADNEPKGLFSAYTCKKCKPRAAKASEAEAPNVLDREFDGHPPHTHIVSDLTYVRVGSKWNYVCLLVDLRNREIVGHAASGRRDARLVKTAFATLGFPLTDIDVFHTDRGSEFANSDIDDLLEAFDIRRSLSRKVTRTTTRSSSPPTGSWRRSSSIGGRSPTLASSAASSAHTFGGITRRGCIRRWAA